jgi:hypothetical protein
MREGNHGFNLLREISTPQFMNKPTMNQPTEDNELGQPSLNEAFV